MNRMPLTAEFLEETGRRFGLRGKLVDAAPWGSGHINDTYRVAYQRDGEQVRYIHQRLNTRVFRDPVALMTNIRRVCAHIAAKTGAGGSGEAVSQRALELIESVDGKPYWVDDEGHYWRTFAFIEGATTRDVIGSVDEAYEIAKAFGCFQAMLNDFPADGIVDTIPGFHDTRKRLEALERAIEEDPLGRVSRAGTEIGFARSRQGLAGVLLDLRDSGEIPLRVTHNDTKANNVLLDARTGAGICVIDLDTVMPGLSLYDFGDLVRGTASATAEDVRDPGNVRARPEIFEALVRGFFSTAGSFLNQVERDHLVTSGMVLSYELGLRFLTDFLDGDHYFRAAREAQNLDRCRTQFALLRDLEHQEPELHSIVARLPR